MYYSKIIHIVEEHLYTYYSTDIEIRDIKEKYSITDIDINSCIKSKGKINRGVEIMALKNIEMQVEINNKIQWKLLIDKILEYYKKNEPDKYLYIKLRYLDKCSTTKIENKMAICRATQARLKSDIVYYIALFAVKEDLIKMQSATSNCGYVYASASRGESTTDTVFSGHSLIADCGVIVGESKFLEDIEITYGEIDIENCENDRTKTTSYMTNVNKQKYERVCIETFAPVTDEFVSNREISILPFVPHNIDERATEILKLQAAGLAGRLKKINCKNVVIGISGGLDSTLALIVAAEAFNINGLDTKGIHAITMPCYGTTDRTLNNAKKLMELLNVTSYEINIKDACEQHYKDIGHDKSNLDVTFENVQARERTQILMDISNKIGGLVVGTGDLSELALGWCTYNGDQMSMYGVNASIPKTLVRGILESYAQHHNELRETLLDICDTPVSPELLPPNEDGTIKQKTEDKIGSYVIHDFILYYMQRHGFGPRKIFDLYINAKTMHEKKMGVENPVIDKADVLKNMEIFYNRFWTQQFKRSCMPDGVKVGSVSLSPRGDWRMASDACQSIWIDELNELKNIIK